MNYNTADIRQFLFDYFNDHELVTVCFDYFRNVCDNFTTGMTKNQKIHLLIEYCERRGITPNLLAAMEKARPQQYWRQFAPVAEAQAEPAKSTRNPRQVFISHAHQDAEFAHRLASDLQERGWRVWIAPESIRPGEKWVEAIERGLDESGVFALVLTPAAVRSRWVKSETNIAIELQHKDCLQFVPLEVEHCDAPKMWVIYQCVSFRSRYEDGLAMLVRTLGQREEEKETDRQGDKVEVEPLRVAVPSAPQKAVSQLPLEPEMILIPAGEFLMGSDPKKDKNAQDREQPQHSLYLLDYYLAKTPVTNAQYMAFVQATGHSQPGHWKDDHLPKGKEDHPVVNVTWYDAMAYCRWLAEATGKPYSLPSEAEWEKSARGTLSQSLSQAGVKQGGRIYPWGDQWDAKRCNSREGGKGDTTPVGAYPLGASPHGLLDMAGNVWEWTRSIFKPYPYDPKDGREDLEAEDNRALRGGSFDDPAGVVRCACRGGYGPDRWDWYYGFRVVILGE